MEQASNDHGRSEAQMAWLYSLGRPCLRSVEGLKNSHSNLVSKVIEAGKYSRPLQICRVCNEEKK